MKVDVTTDVILQTELAAVIFNDRSIAARFFKLVYTDKDVLVRAGGIFANPHINRIVSLFHELWDKNGHEFPTSGIMCTEILKLKLSQDETIAARDLYLKLAAKKVHFDIHHETHLKKIIIDAKTAVFAEDVMSKMKKPSTGVLTLIAEEAKKLTRHLEEVSFVGSDVVHMNDFFAIIEESAREAFSNIPTGLLELDQELNGGGEFGGAGRQEVTVWLAGTNDGKSIALANVAVHCGKVGYKSRTFSFEGKLLQTPIRMISTATGISYKKILKYREFLIHHPQKTVYDYFSKEEAEIVAKVEKEVGEKLKVIHAIKNSTIEHICHLAMEDYKTEAFDVLIIDYGQLVESIKTFHKEHDLLQYVFRQLEKLASVLKVAIHVAMQVNREGMAELNKKADEGEEFPTYKFYHVAGGINTLKTAATIIAISRTDQERKDGKARFTIIKQREGLVGVEVGIHCNFTTSSMFQGKRYRNYNPIESFMSKGSDDMFKPKEGAKTAGVFSQAAVQDGDDLLTKISRSPFLKRLHSTRFSDELKEVCSILKKGVSAKGEIEAIEQAISSAKSGLEEVDQDAIDEKEKYLSEKKLALQDIKDKVLDEYDIIREHVGWVGQLEKLKSDGLLEALRDSTDPGIKTILEHIYVIGFIKMIGLNQESGG